MRTIRNNNTNIKDETMDWSAICFAIYFFLKPFYFFRSGSLQPGDYFLVGSFLLLFLKKRFSTIYKEWYFFLFLVCVVIINLFYSLIYSSTDFLHSTLYYIFNFLAILCFREFITSQKNLKMLEKICKINLLIQLAAYLFGIGEYWAGTYRYMGTYNDPNQMGFAVVSTLAIIYLLEGKWRYLYFFISAFLIYQTYSGGMLIALSLLIAADAFVLLKKYMSSRNTVLIGFVLFLFLSVIVILIAFGKIDIDLTRFRLEEKLERKGGTIHNFLRDRNMTIVTEYPAFFLFGYGEGPSVLRYGHLNELHSTWISICYYYGVVPFYLLLKWIFRNIKGINFKFIPVYLSVFLEAFSLINHRQPAFWMIIILGTIVRNDTASKSVIEKKRAIYTEIE